MDKLFQTLNPEKEHKFREYAAMNDPPDIKKWNLYHPVCREIWRSRGIQPPTERSPPTDHDSSVAEWQ